MSAKAHFVAGKCKFCGKAFVRVRFGIGGRPLAYCNDECRKHRDSRHRAELRRRQKARAPKVTPHDAPEIEIECLCGKPLIGFTFDNLGRTLEICEAGHQTSCVARRRSA